MKKKVEKEDVLIILVKLILTVVAIMACAYVEII